MARIREVLTLEDQFTQTFTSYTQQTAKAANATRRVKNDVDDLARSQASATVATNTFAGALRNLAGAWLGFQGIQLLVGWSDQITGATSRLNIMNDGLQTTKELQDMIFQSAMRARGSYIDTMGFVAKLGTLAGNAFGSSEEVIMFAELINKQMALSGTSAWEGAAAMLQLTQAMSSGVLRGEELNSILEQTPMIAQTIADYLGVSVGEMRNMAAEGLITADVVKNAMFAAQDDINAQFEKMPYTWGQVFTLAQNIAIRALNPLLLAISFLANNIQIIGPAVLAVGAAFAVFQIAAHWTTIATVATTAYHAVVTFLSIAFGMLTGNTAAASAAMFVFNSAMLANPITWVVMLIMVLIGALYVGVAAFNKFSDSSVSATGIIMGALSVLVGFIYNNTIAPIINIFTMASNFISNVFKNPVAAVQVLFYDMALNVLGYIRSLANGIENLINLIPGVEVHFTGAINKIYGSLTAGRNKVISESGYTEYFNAPSYKDLTASFNTGYSMGKGVEKGVINFFTGGSGSIPVTGEGVDGTGMAGDISDISKGVSSINKAVNMSEEDIASLVDIAERRYVNNINLTSQTPVITINGQNTGNTAADRQNLADTIRDILIEQVASGSTRSTARAY